MPNIYTSNGQTARHTDDMQDIITTVPSWILRWGITLFFGLLALIIGLAAFIHYPDVVKTTLKIGTPNTYSKVISKSSGTISEILVQPNEYVKLNQPLAYIESTGPGRTILTAPIAGKVTFAGIMHANDILIRDQELFYIEPGKKEFYGELIIAQNYLGDVHEGQHIRIKLHSYPFEQYGTLQGEIKYISGVADKEGAFLAEVEINNNTSDTNHIINLKPGMTADAEIVTRDATILQRITRNIFKVIK